MDEYISRLELKEALLNIHPDDQTYEEANCIVDQILTANVVPTSVYRQVAWERDTAIEQLHSIGKEFGEKMDDVARVVHARWATKLDPYFEDDPSYECSSCGERFYIDGTPKMAIFNYCPACGAKMDLEATNG